MRLKKRDKSTVNSTDSTDSMNSLNSLNSLNSHKGFTLIEILVVVFIIGLFVGLGVTNYINFSERSRVRGAAGETQAFLRDIQNRAKMRQRGTGICATDAAGALTNKLRGWQVEFLGNSIQAMPECENENGTLIGTGDPVIYNLTHPITITSGENFIYDSLYGNPSYPVGEEVNTIILGDVNNGYYYRFNMGSGGEIEKGDFCSEEECGGNI